MIIDANIADKFGSPPDEEVRPLVDWLTKRGRKGHAVVGGKLRSELNRVGVMRKFLAVLQRAGRLVDKDDEAVNEETQQVLADLEELELHGADDPHIIALARVSDSRLLASQDAGLHTLFKNQDLLKPPRGRIYQNQSHEHLLRSAPACKTCKK